MSNVEYKQSTVEKKSPQENISQGENLEKRIIEEQKAEKWVNVSLHQLEGKQVETETIQKADQLKNEIDKSLDEIQHSEMTQNESKEVRYTSGLLSVAFYLSTIYLVLFISLFALSDIGWGFVVLIFLGPNLLSLAIGAFLLRLGMKRRNKTLLYASIGLYLLSIILAFDPDWEIFRIAPIVLGILVLIGTLLVKDEKSY